MRIQPLVVVAICLLSSGCDELREIDSMGDQTRVPAGGPEKLRLFVPDRVLNRCELIPVVLERVAHEGDNLDFDPGRVRCATMAMVGRGVFVTGSDDNGNLVFSRQIQFDLDRGQSNEGLFTAQDAGSVVLQAALLSAPCVSGDSASTAAAQRITTFAAIGAEDCLDPPIEDAGVDGMGDM